MTKKRDEYSNRETETGTDTQRKKKTEIDRPRQTETDSDRDIQTVTETGKVRHINSQRQSLCLSLCSPCAPRVCAGGASVRLG